MLKNETLCNMKNRYYSLDVLRVFAMVLIVASHMIGQGVFFCNPLTEGIDFDFFYSAPHINRFVAVIFSPGGDMGNFIFFLLMGFFFKFQVPERDRILKIIKLCIQVYFFALITIMGFLDLYLSGVYKFTEMGAMQIFRYICSLYQPMTSGVWWFITTYIFIYILLFSFLGLQRINKKQFLGILIGLFVFNVIRLNSGSYNLIFTNGFVVLIGIYIGRFYKEVKGSIRYIIFAIVLWILAALGQYFHYYVISLNSESIGLKIFELLNDKGLYCSRILFAVNLFLFCLSLENEKIKLATFWSKLSKATFSVYLLHANKVFYVLFITVLGNVSSYFNSYFFVLNLVFSEVVVWTGAFGLDLIQSTINEKVITYLQRKLRF